MDGHYSRDIACLVSFITIFISCNRRREIYSHPRPRGACKSGDVGDSFSTFTCTQVEIKNWTAHSAWARPAEGEMGDVHLCTRNVTGNRKLTADKKASHKFYCFQDSVETIYRECRWKENVRRRPKFVNLWQDIKLKRAACTYLDRLTQYFYCWRYHGRVCVCESGIVNAQHRWSNDDAERHKITDRAITSMTIPFVFFGSFGFPNYTRTLNYVSDIVIKDRTHQTTLGSWHKPAWSGVVLM